MDDEIEEIIPGNRYFGGEELCLTITVERPAEVSVSKKNIGRAE
jgi:hypothetical protein